LARSTKGTRALVTGEEHEGSPGSEIQGTLQPREQSDQRLPQTNDGSRLVENKVAAVGDEQSLSSARS
jgi:hypothetical protein